MSNIDVMNLFENYLRNIKQASSNTLYSYLRDIRQLSEYLDDNTEHSIISASEIDLDNYISYIRSLGKSIPSVSRSIASIKCLYSFLGINQYIKKNPSLKLVPDKVVKKYPEILSEKEVILLLSQPSCVDAKGYRDKAMLELLYTTGLRVTEMMDLNVSNINLKMGYITCISKTKERIIPIYSGAVKALSDYITFVRPQMVSDSNENALFVNVSGERMSRQGFWKIVKYYAKKANISKDITPHTLRHSFAAHLIENGADIKSLQEMMGHSDISSTQAYSNLVKNSIKDVYNRAHPHASVC